MMTMSYSKEEVKELIELEDIFLLLEYYKAEPQMYADHIEALTICHGGDSHKLYYYENSQLFTCYTGGCGKFDVFELVQKLEHLDDFNAAIYFVVQFLNLEGSVTDVEVLNTEDQKAFREYQRVAKIHGEQTEKLILPQIDKSILEHYPQPLIRSWEREGIVKEVCDYMNIRYDPVNGGILIPHTDENGRLVGIRTLIKEVEEQYGKYRPWTKHGQMFNHPLAFNLYGLEQAKENIQKKKTAIVVESEKAVMQYLSYIGLGNDMCVAVCGSSISKYQFHLLVSLGVKDLIIAFDKDFKEIGSQEYYENRDKMIRLARKFTSQVNVSIIWDESNLLDYKSSPLDHGKDVFQYLFRENRIILR